MKTTSNSENDAIGHFLTLARRIPAAKSELPCFSSASLKKRGAQPGEIWTTRPDSGASKRDQSSLWVLVTKRVEWEGQALFCVAPLFSDPKMADASDVILRAGLLGFPAVVSLGLQISMTLEALDCRVAKLPGGEMRLLRSFSKWLDGGRGACPKGVERGVPYLDTLDTRITFHENLLAQIQHLQSPLQVWVSAEEMKPGSGSASKVIVVAFGPALQEALQARAAADGTGLYHEAFKVESLEVSIDVEAQAKPGSFVGFNVFDRHGEPCDQMDGCVILGGDGVRLGKIEGHSASVPVEKFHGTFSILRGGVPLMLAPEGR
jgi:hypothetical protein